MQYKLLSDYPNNEVHVNDELVKELHMQASEYEEVIDQNATELWSLCLLHRSMVQTRSTTEESHYHALCDTQR